MHVASSIQIVLTGYVYGNERGNLEEDIVNKRESHDEREWGTNEGTWERARGTLHMRGRGAWS